MNPDSRRHMRDGDRTVLIKNYDNAIYHWGERCPMTDAHPANYKPVSRIEAWRQGRRPCRRCR